MSSSSRELSQSAEKATASPLPPDLRLPLRQGEPLLDTHGYIDGVALSLIWFCPTCQAETSREFVAGFPTLSLAARARMLATKSQSQQKAA